MLKYQNGYIFDGHTFVVNKEDIHNAPDDLFVEATALLPDGWISVKDRLPEQMKKVLTTVEYDFNGKHYRNLKIAYYDGNGKWEPLSRQTDEITHWMPLPEPPEANP